MPGSKCMDEKFGEQIHFSFAEALKFFFSGWPTAIYTWSGSQLIWNSIYQILARYLCILMQLMLDYMDSFFFLSEISLADKHRDKKQTTEGAPVIICSVINGNLPRLCKMSDNHPRSSSCSKLFSQKGQNKMLPAERGTSACSLQLEANTFPFWAGMCL